MLAREKATPAKAGVSGIEIKVMNAALEERSNGDIILRGSISPESLRNLRTDDYQREVLSVSSGKKSRLRKGVENGVTLPDIELGMRGSNVSFHGKTATLHDMVYIIDGLQRVSALIQYMDDNGADGFSNTNPLGATIHFSTTKEWEKQRFADLNTLRTPVSPNVILRNARDKHPSILTIYGLSHADAGFALYRRVCWNQRMNKGELVSAAAMVRAGSAMHRHIIDRVVQPSGARILTVGQGRGDKSVARSPVILDKVAKEIGLNNFRENVKDFFEIVDRCWGIRSVEYGQAQAHLRGNFISTLGAFMSSNEELWKDSTMKRLFIDSKTISRLAAFPVNDPEIRRLCSAGTMVLPTLYTYLLKHMNKGKSKHLFK